MPNPLRHRSVWQVLGIYAVASWVVFQVVLALRDGLGLPDGLPKYAAILLIVGLPIVLATAFVQHRMSVAAEARQGDERRLDPTLHPGLAYAADDSLNNNVAYNKFPSHLLTWKRSLLGGVGAFLCLGLGTTGFMAVRHRNSLTAQGIISSDEPVVLADFSSASDPALGETITEALRVDLEQSSALRLAQAPQLNAALLLMKRKPTDGLPADIAVNLANREGLKAVITGDVSRLGSGYVLVSEVRAAAGDSVLASFRSTARDSLGLVDAVNTLSKEMRDRIGESLKSIRASVPLERATTASMPALRKYGEAQRMEAETGDPMRAIELLRQAVTIDSTFAEAWRKLAVSLNNIGLAPDEQKAAMTKAYELRERLSEKEQYRVVASYDNLVLRDFDGAIEAYRRLLEIDAHDPAGLNNLSLLLRNAHRFAEAEALLDTLVNIKGAVIAPVEWLNLVNVELSLGKIPQAKATWARAVAALPNNATIAANVTTLAAMENRWDDVDSLTRSVGTRYPDMGTAQRRMLRDRAAAAMIQGRLRDAANYQRAVADIFEGKSASGRLEALLNAPEYYARIGEIERARQTLDEALQRVPLDSIVESERPYNRLAGIFMLTRQPARADQMLRDHKDAFTATDVARIELDRGNAAASLAALRTATERGGCNICGLPYLANAYDALGQTDSARVIYERYLNTPSYYRITSDPVWRPLILSRVAELHEAAGNKTMAAKRYTELLHLWRNADPFLAPRVSAVKARLLALQGKG